MENLNIILFLSIVAPLLMMLFICKGKSRHILLYLLIGIAVCLFSSELSGLLKSMLPSPYPEFFTINVTPFTEEVLKAIPVLLYIFLFKPEDQSILESSIAIGVGFAILENTFVLAGNVNVISIVFALIRGFGAGMMHGLCTFIVGYGMTYVYKKRKLFIPGTAALISVAVMYHSLYNILVQSDYQLAGFLLPVLTFTPFIILRKHGRI